MKKIAYVEIFLTTVATKQTFTVFKPISSSITVILIKLLHSDLVRTNVIKMSLINKAEYGLEVKHKC